MVLHKQFDGTEYKQIHGIEIQTHVSHDSLQKRLPSHSASFTLCMVAFEEGDGEGKG